MTLRSPDVPPTLARILQYFPDARQNGRGWYAACPAAGISHSEDTRDAGVAIRQADDGRVSIVCESGCELIDLLELAGLKPDDLAPREGERLPGQLARAIRAIDAPKSQPIEWIIDELFTAGEIGLLVGDGGSFKSTAAINMAAALAGGYRVWNRFAVTRRPALICSAEDSMDIVMMRLEAFVVGHGWDRQRVLENVHLFTTTEVSLANRQWQQHIVDETRRLGAGLVVLDPFAELIEGDENSNSEIRPTVKFLRALGRDTGAAVIVVHHAGKQGQDKRALDRIRGASALPSGARSILFFDYQPHGAGVAVEHLKMNRTERLDRFLLTRHVEHEPQNRAQWTSATLGYADIAELTADKAQTFVLATITASPRTHSTSDLRKLAKAERLRPEAIGQALMMLQAAGQIGFEAGARGAKKWFVIAAHAASEIPFTDTSTGPESA